MPKKCEGLGLSFLYPDNWKSTEEELPDAISIESPEGAFLAVTRLQGIDLETPIEKAKQTMEAEYDQIEQEPVHKRIGDKQLIGVTQRFVYLDLIVTSHLLAFTSNGCTYLIQIQAEDRDMNRLEQVFEAVLTSICQSVPV